MKALIIGLLMSLSATAWAGPGALFVTYFENQGNPELAPLRVGLAQMLITDLSKTPGLTVVERTQLNELLKELELQGSGKVDPSTLAARGKLIGAKWMLTGTYVSLMGTLRIDARLVDVETGRVLAAHGESGKEGEIWGLEARLVKSLSGDLVGLIGAAVVPAEELPAKQGPTRAGTAVAAEQSVAPPERMSAALRYSEGLLALDGRELTRARERFEAAVAADPELDAAKVALAGLSL